MYGCSICLELDSQRVWPVIDYIRDRACKLRLASDCIPDWPDYERWVLVMLDEPLEKPGAEYYREAQARFEDVEFLVFSDDAARCERNLDGGRRPRFVEGRPDYVDLLLMSRCDHHIIANSTFSWWGAYLNPSTDKRVVYPCPWHRGEKHARDFRDFIPSGWVPARVRRSGKGLLWRA